MAKIQVRTNGHKRMLLRPRDLTKAERQKYCPWAPYASKEAYFRFRRRVFRVGDFFPVEEREELEGAEHSKDTPLEYGLYLLGWDSYTQISPEGYFMALKFPDAEHVVVGVIAWA